MINSMALAEGMTHASAATGNESDSDKGCVRGGNTPLTVE